MFFMGDPAGIRTGAVGLCLLPFAAAAGFFAALDDAGDDEERGDGGNGGKRQGEIQRGICTFGFDRQPQIVHRLRGFDTELGERFAARERLVIRVGDRAGDDFFVQILLRGGLRCGVADVVEVCSRNVRAAQEVDEGLCARQ